MKWFVIIIPVVALATTGCRSAPRDVDEQWLKQPTQSQLEESAGTVIRLRKQLGKQP